MARVLFLGHVVPFPPNSGQRIRNSTILEALVLEGHEVTLVTLSEPYETVGDELKALCRAVELIPHKEVTGIKQYIKRLLLVPSIYPFGVNRFKCKAALEAVRKYTTCGDIDAIICDDIYNVMNLPNGLSVPVLLNKHDITHEKHRRFLGQERNIFKLVYGWIEYVKVRRWEMIHCSKYSCVLACSERDKELLEPMCSGVPVRVVPNIIDVEKYALTLASDDKILLFVGAMDWYPNCDAVEFFVYSILPILRKTIPEVRFIVAGRDPSESFQRQFSEFPDVEFTGTVQDMREEIARAAVCVVPLRIGSGTRLKIIEAAAMGKPTVSTYIGAEGLDFVDGEEIIREDDPERSAKVIEGLMSNHKLRVKMGQAARKRVENQYSIPILRKTLSGAISSVLGK